GDPPALGSAPDYITLGAGAQNVRVLGESYVAIRNDNGTPVRPPEASYLEENEYTHSAAWADASWGKSANVVTVENSATDGTKFIDGTAPMHVVVSGTCSKTSPARINQSLGPKGGHVVGIRTWVRCAAGGTGTICPSISGTAAVTGSGVGLPHRLQITDQWQEVEWTAGMPAGDPANTFAGWYFFPTDATTVDFYFAQSSAWFDGLRPPRYVGTTTSATSVQPNTTMGALTVSGNATVAG